MESEIWHKWTYPQDRNKPINIENHLVVAKWERLGERRPGNLGLADVNWRRQWHSTPVLLPGKSHGWRSLVGCSPWGREELDTTEQLHFHFSLSCIGEGNGNPLQCPCLENPRDRGAWWAAIYGVAQNWTRLKRLSSSSSTVIWSALLFPYYREKNWDFKGLGPRHGWATSLSLSCIGEGNGNPLQCSWESQEPGSLVGCRLWGRTESDTTEAI